MVKQMSHSDPGRYSDPELRDRIKEEVTRGDKGGKPGQWSARKAQLVAHEYEQQGGGYKQAPAKEQQSLKQWGDEKWRTEDGKKAERKGGTTRYLPEKAWEALSPEERSATNRKKQEGSKKGKQFVANTKPAAEARKKETSKTTAASATTAKKGATGRQADKAPAKKAATKRTAAKTSPTKKTAAKKKAAGKSAESKASAKKGAAKVAKKNS